MTSQDSGSLVSQSDELQVTTMDLLSQTPEMDDVFAPGME
jgi:hypothetical protein